MNQQNEHEPSVATRETRGTPPELSVNETLRWLRKLEKLTTDAAKLIHIQHLLEKAARVSQPVAPPPNEIEHLRRMVRLLCDDGVNLEYCRDLAKRTFQSPAAEPVAPGASATSIKVTGSNLSVNSGLEWLKSEALSRAAAPAGTQPAQEGECEHVWKAHIDSQFSNEAVTDVFCEKCNVSGEMDNQTKEVYWPAT